MKNVLKILLVIFLGVILLKRFYKVKKFAKQNTRTPHKGLDLSPPVHMGSDDFAETI